MSAQYFVRSSSVRFKCRLYQLGQLGRGHQSLFRRPSWDTIIYSQLYLHVFSKQQNFLLQMFSNLIVIMFTWSMVKDVQTCSCVSSQIGCTFWCNGGNLSWWLWSSASSFWWRYRTGFCHGCVHCQWTGTSCQCSCHLWPGKTKENCYWLMLHQFPIEDGATIWWRGNVIVTCSIAKIKKYIMYIFELYQNPLWLEFLAKIMREKIKHFISSLDAMLLKIMMEDLKNTFLYTLGSKTK